MRPYRPGINALSGPLHGGANQAVMDMLRTIQREGDPRQVHREGQRQEVELQAEWASGTRVYKNFDPRGKIIKEACDKILKRMNIKDPLLDIARRLEDRALSDKYFIEKKLYPNVDFYSGIIYRAIGIPENMFTVMFALGRLPGWIAHWKEMVESKNRKIARPRQIYVGRSIYHYKADEHLVNNYLNYPQLYQ